MSQEALFESLAVQLSKITEVCVCCEWFWQVSFFICKTFISCQPLKFYIFAFLAVLISFFFIELKIGQVIGV